MSRTLSRLSSEERDALAAATEVGDLIILSKLESASSTLKRAAARKLISAAEKVHDLYVILLDRKHPLWREAFDRSIKIAKTFEQAWDVTCTTRPKSPTERLAFDKALRLCRAEADLKRLAWLIGQQWHTICVRWHLLHQIFADSQDRRDRRYLRKQNRK